MSIKLKELWPPRDGMQKIPVYKEGGIAVFGERTIFQSPVILRKGLPECLLWSDPKNRGDEDVELISIIRMSPGLDLEIRRNDEEIQGVKFYKPNGDLLEFAPFSEDGKGLECNNAYDHITIDPANNDREAQLVRVGWNLIDTSLKPQ